MGEESIKNTCVCVCVCVCVVCVSGMYVVCVLWDVGTVFAVCACCVCMLHGGVRVCVLCYVWGMWRGGVACYVWCVWCVGRGEGLTDEDEKSCVYRKQF